MTTAAYDCRKCGACCVDQLILVRDDDRVPMMMVDGDFMRRQLGRCVALCGRVGINTHCSIYSQRPAICRAMIPGVKECLIIRESCGLSGEVSP